MPASVTMRTIGLSPITAHFRSTIFIGPVAPFHFVGRASWR
jgi:hypothetical protein